MLQFTPVVQETYPMTLTRNSFLPLVCACLFYVFITSYQSWFRSLLVAVTRLPSVHALKSGMIPQLFEILEASSLNIARLSLMASWPSSRVTCTWNPSLLHGTIWCVLVPMRIGTTVRMKFSRVFSMKYGNTSSYLSKLPMPMRQASRWRTIGGYLFCTTL